MLRALRKFITDRRGNVAMITALAIVPISVLVGASVDLSRMRVERTRLQSAVDAAVLAAANMPRATSDDDVEDAVDNFIAANFAGSSDIYDTDVRRTGAGVEATSYADVNLTFAALLGRDTRRISAHAIAERGGANLEIALVLDITQSMASPSSKIQDLREAAEDLVETLLDDENEDVDVRIALIPYSNSVNVGSTIAAAVRGPAVAGKTVATMTWSAGQKTPTGISRANPGIVSLNNHGYTNGQVIYFSGVKGMTQLNGNTYTVERRDANSFYLLNSNGNRVSTSNYGSFSTSGSGGNTARIDRCLNTNCYQVVTANGHGFQNNDRVYLTGMSGSLGSAFNNQAWIVKDKTNDSFVIQERNYITTPATGGQAFCTTAGCQYYHFTNKNNSPTVFPLLNCASERTGAQAYTDATPASARVGRVYGPSASFCPAKPVRMLTDNENSLVNDIRTLATTGSTAGQIGIAWGWYALAPNFNSALGNDAVEYNDPETRKIAVIMTDGAFNTSYCNGVVAGDSSYDPRYGYTVDASQRINCNSTNGDEFAQARQLCTAMKAAGITIYTIAFDVGRNSTEAQFMADCSSGSDYAKIAAASGNSLQTAFAEIGDSIGQLRLTR